MERDAWAVGLAYSVHACSIVVVVEDVQKGLSLRSP